jgi:transcriptional regulator of acetoin/glycerol metabolism
MNLIDAVIADLKSLNSVEKGKITEIATKYGVPRSTLSKRWRG